MQKRNSVQQTLCVILFSFLAFVLAAPSFAQGVEAGDAFEQLKALAGTWQGTPEGKGEAKADAELTDEVTHEFQLSAAGTVVMETMSPGTPHEMINMYHVDGEDLVLTHYCAGGNQPRMRLDRKKSTAKKYIFDFDGGTNFDPAVDPHIHSAAIEWVDGGGLDSMWTAHAGGKEVALMTFHLARSE